MACYSTGNVTATITDGYANVGGVVGINGQGTVTACYHATGEITSLGGGRIGGIVGENYIGTVAACYWDSNLSSGTGSNNGKDDTHKVDGTDVPGRRQLPHERRPAERRLRVALRTHRSIAYLEETVNRWAGKVPPETGDNRSNNSCISVIEK